MCKKLTVVNREDLGNRVVGYVLYNHDTADFVGYTAKQIKDRLTAGSIINGFILDETGELVLDANDFHQTNYMVRSGISNLEPLNDAGCINMLYSVVAVHKESKENIYTVVSSRYGRHEFTESKIKMLLELGCIQGGVYMDGKKLVVCTGVDVLDTVEGGGVI